MRFANAARRLQRALSINADVLPGPANERAWRCQALYANMCTSSTSAKSQPGADTNPPDRAAVRNASPPRTRGGPARRPPTRSSPAIGGRQGELKVSPNRSDVPAALAEPLRISSSDGVLEFEVGRVARLAGASVMARTSSDAVMATVVRAPAEQPDAEGGVNLQLEYREKAAARGRIPGSFQRRENSGSEKETLAGRLIDRGLRPLFSKGVSADEDIQLVCSLLSAAPEADTDALAINASSAVLLLGHGQWNGPVSAVRVAKAAGGELIANPSLEQLRRSALNLMYVGTRECVLAIEAECDELPENEFLDALAFAHRAIQPALDAQIELGRRYAAMRRENDARSADASTKPPPLPPLQRAAEVERLRKDHFDEYVSIFRKSRGVGKERRSALIGAALSRDAKRVRERLSAAGGGDGQNVPPEHEVHAALDTVMREAFRSEILRGGIRCDGRQLNQIRSIRAQAGVLGGCVHGSALFERGDTQVLATATLGLPRQALSIDAYLGVVERTKRFMVHYDFPPFCTGEVGRIGGRSGRREIGHGVLAERSLAALVPVVEEELDPDAIFAGRTTSVGLKRDRRDEFPYVVRVNAEVLGSDGSSSMATACAGSLAMMDAGVPLRAHVAGISIGMVSSDDGRHTRLLTDILGIEDHYGDMDFKVAGTMKGITGVQLDVKLPRGLTQSMLRPTLAAARDARVQLLRIMNRAIERAAERLSPAAPRVSALQVPPLMRPVFTAQGSVMLRRIQSATQAELSLDEVGELTICAPSEASLQLARRMVQDLIGDVEIGTRYYGRVSSVRDFGAFVEVLPGRQGLLHVSELAGGDARLRAEDAAKVGDMLSVEVVDYDNLRGLIKLRRADRQPPPEGGSAASASSSSPPRRAAANAANMNRAGANASSIVAK